MSDDINKYADGSDYRNVTIEELKQENHKLREALIGCSDAYNKLACEVGEDECFREIIIAMEYKAIAQNKE